MASTQLIQCGGEAAKHFAFEAGYRNLNHGSFGTAPTAVRTVQRQRQDEAEAKPDNYIRYAYPKQLDRSREAIANYLNAPVETCVYVANATTGVNTVLRNLVYKPGDVIIYFATIYGACEKSLSYLEETTPVSTHKIQYTYPISDAVLCDLFTAAIATLRSQGKDPRLALFDTVVSLPGVRMPFERLTTLCKSHDVLSLIDGAHSVGHFPLDLTALDPDFYVSNCHKWLHVPRGCAVLYVPLRNQTTMRSTLPTSHGFQPAPGFGEGINNPLPKTDKSVFVTNFEFVGSLDNSPYVCVEAALEWRDKVVWKGKRGEEAVMAYCLRLGRRSGEIVSNVLGTEVMENAEGTLGNCAMSNVRLPLDPKALTDGDMAKVAKISQWIPRILVEEYKTFIAIIFYGGVWWVRFSGQVYLTEGDFEWAARTLLEVCARVKKGDWKETETTAKL